MGLHHTVDLQVNWAQSPNSIICENSGPRLYGRIPNLTPSVLLTLFPSLLAMFLFATLKKSIYFSLASLKRLEFTDRAMEGLTLQDAQQLTVPGPQLHCLSHAQWACHTQSLLQLVPLLPSWEAATTGQSAFPSFPRITRTNIFSILSLYIHPTSTVNRSNLRYTAKVKYLRVERLVLLTIVRCNHYINVGKAYNREFSYQ